MWAGCTSGNQGLWKSTQARGRSGHAQTSAALAASAVHGTGKFLCCSTRPAFYSTPCLISLALSNALVLPVDASACPAAASLMPSTLPPGCMLASPVWTASAVTSPLGPPLPSAQAHRCAPPASTASLCGPAPCTIVGRAVTAWDFTSLAAISELLARAQTGLEPLLTPYTGIRDTLGAQRSKIQNAG